MDVVNGLMLHRFRGVEPFDTSSIIYVEREEPSGTSTAFRINTAPNR